MSERVARSDQCSVARICNASDCDAAGGWRSSTSVLREVARKLREGLETARGEERGDAVVHLRDRAGVGERRGADLHRGATGDEELERVGGGHDAAHADD